MNRNVGCINTAIILSIFATLPSIDNNGTQRLRCSLVQQRRHEKASTTWVVASCQDLWMLFLPLTPSQVSTQPGPKAKGKLPLSAALPPTLLKSVNVQLFVSFTDTLTQRDHSMGASAHPTQPGLRGPGPLASSFTRCHTHRS